jgi:hypothetical protein
VYRFLAIAAVAACGRVGFEVHATDAVVVDAASSDAAPQAPVCGDSTCNGTEVCATCAADCAVRTPVCGNGQCDPGETGTSCMADCGPSPWPFVTEADQLVQKINQLRAAGTSCTGGSPSPVPALAVDMTLVPPAREWAWEIAFQNTHLDVAACNGRTFGDRLGPLSAKAVDFATGSSLTPVGAANLWMMDQSECGSIMSASSTLIGAAVAHYSDADNATVYIVILK